MRSLRDLESRAKILEKTGNCLEVISALTLLFVPIYWVWAKQGVLSVLIICAASFVLFIAAVLDSYATTLDDRVKQALKNEKAKSYDGPYYLLLRPFVKTELYTETWDLDDVDESGIRINAPPSIFHKIIPKLELAIHDKAIIVAIDEVYGWRDAHSNLVNIYLDSSQWREEVRHLAMHSKAIFLLPESSQGLLEEMKIIKTRWDIYRKTILIMPPLQYKSNYSTLSVQGMELNEWERMRRDLQQYNYNLPYGNKAGMVFTINADFSIGKKILLSKDKGDWGIVDALDSLTTGFEEGWLPLKYVYTSLDSHLPQVNFDTWDIMRFRPLFVILSLINFLLFLLISFAIIVM